MRSHRTSVRRRRPRCSEAKSVGREPQRMVRRRSLCKKCRGWHRFSEGTACRLSEDSQCITSGAKSPSNTLFPPHLTHKETTNLPSTALCGTFQFPQCVTSGAKMPSHSLFSPHLTHQESVKLISGELVRRKCVFAHGVGRICSWCAERSILRTDCCCNKLVT